MDENSTLDHFFVGKKLGEGTFGKVKLGTDRVSGSIVALKIIKPALGSLQSVIYQQSIREVQSLSQLSHPNIVRLLHTSETGQYYSRKKKQIFQRFYLATEFEPHGDMYDLVRYAGRLREEVARALFRQLISAVHEAHRCGLSHRDIKPENILLGTEFQMKLVDFGWAGSLLGRDGSGYMHTKAGTEAYMSPEVISQQVYSGTAADLFSCGVVLFVLVTGRPPFSTAVASDRAYSLFVHSNQTYWEMFTKRVPGLTTDLINLLNGMLACNPCDRLTLNQVESHTWYTSPIPSPEDLYEELKSLYDRALSNPYNPNRRHSGGPGGGANTTYKDDLGSSQKGDPDVSLQAYPWQVLSSTVLSSPMTAENCLRTAIEIFTDHHFTFIQIDRKFKLKVIANVCTDEDYGEELMTLKFTLELFVDPKDSSMVLIEVKKEEGDKYQFFRLFDEFRNAFQVAER